MASWPDLTEYHEAVQHPQQAFTDAELRVASIELDRFGMPKPATGGNAVVYRATESGRTWAIRCFLRPISDHAERYDAISKQLHKAKLPYSTRFIFQRDGIQVRGEKYPMVKMEWVEGDLLHRYIEKNLGNRRALSALRDEWRTLVRELEAAGIGHGDLQHGNILVRGTDLLLVDYDGMWVPALKRRIAIEVGHRSYQHPKRTEADFGPRQDRFSALAIYLSIAALEVDPELWNEYHTGDNLILVRDDYRDPGASGIWRSLAGLQSEEIDLLTEALADCIQRAPGDVPDLEEILRGGKRGKRRVSADESPQARPTGLPSWLKSGAPAALPVLDLAREWDVIWTRPGERVEVRWRKKDPVDGSPEAIQAEAKATDPDAPPTETSTAGSGVVGRVAAMLRKNTRPVESEDEPESDQIREEVRTIAPGMESGVASLLASAEGRHLAVIAKNGQCGFWNVVSDGFKPATARLPGLRIAAFAPRIPTAIVAGPHEASVWDIAGWIRTDCPVDGGSAISSVAISTGASRVAIGYESALVHLVDVRSRRIDGDLRNHGGPVSALALSDDGQLLFSATAAGAVWLSKVAGPVKLADGFAHSSAIRAVAVAPGDQFFAAGDDQGNVTVWGRELRQHFSVPLCDSGVSALCFLGERDLALAVGCNDGTVKIISVGAGRVVVAFQLDGRPVTALSFSATRPGLAAGTAEGHVSLMALP